MVDRQRVASMLAHLEGYVAALRELGAIPRRAFLADVHLAASAKYHLTISIQCCLDIANHVIASEGFRPPNDYADAFAILVKEGILPPEMRQPLKKIARFRNLLVHVYADIDDARVYQCLQEDLGDFDLFARCVSRLE